MSFFKKLIGEAAAAPVKEIGKIIDNVHTSREEELSAEQKLTETVTSLQRLQAQITKSESQHRSIFVAGWRPACGWVCVTGLFFNFIVAPLLSPWVTIETSGIAMNTSIARPVGRKNQKKVRCFMAVPMDWTWWRGVAPSPVHEKA